MLFVKIITAYQHEVAVTCQHHHGRASIGQHIGIIEGYGRRSLVVLHAEHIAATQQVDSMHIAPMDFPVGNEGRIPEYPVSSCTCTCAHLQSLQLLVPDLHTHRSTSNSLGCPEGAELTEAPAPKSSKDIRDKARISTPPPHVGRPQALAHCQTSWRRSYTCFEYLRKRVRLLCGALIAGQSPAFAHPCLRPGPRCRLSLGSKPQSFPQGSPLKSSFSTQPLCTPAEDSHLGPGSAVRWSGPSVLALLGSVCHKPAAALFSEPPEGPVCPG